MTNINNKHIHRVNKQNEFVEMITDTKQFDQFVK